MDEDWSEVSDATVRKRLQNRLAQRKHRMKAQEQAKKSANNASAAASQPQFTAPEEFAFSPSFILPMEARGADPRSHTDGTAGDTGRNDFTTNEPAPQGFFVGNTWNQSAGDSGGSGDGTVQAREILDNSWRDVGHSAPPRAEQPWRGAISAGVAPDSEAGTPETIKQHTCGQYVTPGLNLVPLRTVVYPEGNPCLQQFAPNSPLANTVPQPNNRKRGSAVPEPGLAANIGDHCSECGHHKRQKDGQNSFVAVNAYGGSQGLPVGSYTSRQGVPSLISPAHTPTPSSIMRDHGIDLAQLIPRTNHPRRESTPAASTGRGAAHVRSPKRRFSDTNTASQCSHDQEQAVIHPDTLEKQQYDVLERHEYTEGDKVGAGPKVTKVVVIYMQEKRCGPG